MEEPPNRIGNLNERIGSLEKQLEDFEDYKLYKVLYELAKKENTAHIGSLETQLRHRTNPVLTSPRFF